MTASFITLCNHSQQVVLILTTDNFKALLLSDLQLKTFSHILIALISVFNFTDGATRILPGFLSFYLPMTSIHSGAHDDRHCEKESTQESTQGTREDRSTINFGCVGVLTQATCVAGNHCAMALVQSFLIKYLKASSLQF